MTDCLDIYDILIDYLNCRLDQKENSKVVVHLSCCKKCREDIAFLIKLKKNQMDSLKEVPNKVKLSAFDLITEMQPKSSTLIYLDQLYCSFKLVGCMFKIANQFLEGGKNYV